jgi:group I intron endonuclease
MYIYKTTNLVNGKIYIGKSKRKINESLNYLGSGIVVNQAIEKYGSKNFKKEILDKTKNPEDLNIKEIFWIKKLKSTNPDIGYNRSGGGDGFTKILPETVEKIRQKNLGRKNTKESKLKMSLAAKDKPKSEEHKKSLKEAWKKRKIEKPHTEETLRKMSESMKGKNVGKYVKIYQFKGPDGKIYTTEKGLVKFAQSIHKHPLNFRELIQGIKKEYHGWTYIKTITE